MSNSYEQTCKKNIKNQPEDWLINKYEKMLREMQIKQ